MIVLKNTLRKFWWDGRNGHSTYFLYFLMLVNSVLIIFNFLIKENEIFEHTINLWMFIIIFLIFYFPISILIGRWHKNNQISIDQAVHYYGNPLFAQMIRTLLDTKTGKASEEEIEEFRKIMLKIEKQDIGEF